MPGLAEAHLDLVADHRDAVGAAAVVKLCQEPVRRHHQPAVGQDRLDDQAGDGPGREVLLGEVKARGDVGIDIAAGGPERVGVGQENDIGIRCRPGVDVHARDAHGDADAAVIAVLERDHRALARSVPAGPKGDIVRVRSRVAQIDSSFTAARHERQQVLGKAHRIGMHRRQPACAWRRAHCPADGFGDGGVAVSEPAGRPGSRQVEQFAALGSDKGRAVSGHHLEREEAQLLDARDRGFVPFVEGAHDLRFNSADSDSPTRLAMPDAATAMINPMMHQ